MNTLARYLRPVQEHRAYVPIARERWSSHVEVRHVRQATCLRQGLELKSSTPEGATNHDGRALGLLVFLVLEMVSLEAK